jgi:hypothetical protein
MFRVWHLCLTPVCGTRGSGLAIVLFLASAILLTRFAIWLAGGSRSGSTPTPGADAHFRAPGSCRARNPSRRDG